MRYNQQEVEPLATSGPAFGAPHRQYVLRVDALVSRNDTLSDSIHRNTALAKRQRNTARRPDSIVRDLYDVLPESVDSQVAVIAVLCATICAMGPYDQVAPKALLLMLIYLLSRSSGTRDRALVRDVTYSETNSVTLLDALGRRFTLPFELCGTYDHLHSTLVTLFSHTDGHWFVDTHRYNVRANQQCLARVPASDSRMAPSRLQTGRIS